MCIVFTVSNIDILMLVPSHLKIVNLKSFFSCIAAIVILTQMQFSYRFVGEAASIVILRGFSDSDPKKHTTCTLDSSLICHST